MNFQKIIAAFLGSALLFGCSNSEFNGDSRVVRSAKEDDAKVGPNAKKLSKLDGTEDPQNGSFALLNVSPKTVVMMVGTKANFKATAVYNDGSTKDVSLVANWTSEDSDAMSAVMDASVAEASVTALRVGTYKLTAEQSGLSDTAEVQIKQVNLVSLEVTPDVASVYVGNSVGFQVFATYDDGSRQDLTEDNAVWSVSDASVASIGAKDGNASGLKVGAVIVSASYQGKSASANLSVAAAPVVNPPVQNPPTQNPPAQNPPNVTDKVNVPIAGGDSQIGRCSQDMYVSARANPYFAGSSAVNTIWYSSFCPKSVAKAGRPDMLAYDAPVRVNLIDQNCLRAGSKFYFDVNGAMAHGDRMGATGPDGYGLTHHTLQAWDGKSDLYAPQNSLVGVFLGDSLGAAPETLNFGTTATMDYLNLKPKIGQLFFIGNGFTSGNLAQSVEVPAGAKNVWVGVMDSCVWADNTGGFTVSTFWAP